jgi:hypothetical protein
LLEAFDAVPLAAALAAGADARRLFCMFERDLPIFVVPALGEDAASCALAGKKANDETTANTSSALLGKRFILGLDIGVLGLCVAICSDFQPMT